MVIIFLNKYIINFSVKSWQKSIKRASQSIKIRIVIQLFSKQIFLLLLFSDSLILHNTYHRQYYNLIVNHILRDSSSSLRLRSEMVEWIPTLAISRNCRRDGAARVSVFRLDSFDLIYIATSYSAPRHFCVYTRVDSSRTKVSRPRWYIIYRLRKTLCRVYPRLWEFSRGHVIAKWNSALNNQFSFNIAFLFFFLFYPSPSLQQFPLIYLLDFTRSYYCFF